MTHSDIIDIPKALKNIQYLAQHQREKKVKAFYMSKQLYELYLVQIESMLPEEGNNKFYGSFVLVDENQLFITYLLE